MTEKEKLGQDLAKFVAIVATGFSVWAAGVVVILELNRAGVI